MASFKPISRRDRAIIVSEFSGYLHGACFFFAIAVARGTGAQLVVLESGGTILHAGVRAGSMFRDLRGDTDEARFVSPYVCGSDYVVRDASEVELLKVSEEANGTPITDEQIAYTLRRAESIWPEWGWKDSRLGKVMAFAEELEGLCARHGVWLREKVPMEPMVAYICQAEGDESFEVEHFPNSSNQFTLRRKIG